MLLWFAGTAFATVVLVFGSAAVDYRRVIIGALVPSVVHLWSDLWILHSLAVPVAVMALVMLAATGRRLVQRRWLGLPIGLFLHLVFAGAWRSTTLFWWPAFGLTVGAEDRPGLPPTAIVIVLELLGLAILVWAWRRFGLADQARRTRFLRTGQLDRRLLPSVPPS